MTSPAATLSAPRGAVHAAAQSRRVLCITIAVSLAAHVMAVLLLPGFRARQAEPPRPLEVQLVQPPVPPPIKVAKPEPPPPPPRPREVEKPKPRPARVEPPRPSAVPPPPQPRVLALPEAPAAPAPAFTVPQATIEPAPAPEPKVSAAPPAPPAPPAPAREQATLTPPNFNAAYLRNAAPRYPLIARRNGVEGVVRLKVLVTKDGKPAQVQLERTSGAAVLDNAAIEAVKGWQFVPARKGQDPVESWVIVPLVFKLENAS